MHECGVSIAQLGEYSSIPSRPDARAPWLVVLLDFFATGTFVGIPRRPFRNLSKIVCFHFPSQSGIVPQQLTSARLGSDNSLVLRSHKSVSPPRNREMRFREPGLHREPRSGTATYIEYPNPVRCCPPPAALQGVNKALRIGKARRIDSLESIWSPSASRTRLFSSARRLAALACARRWSRLLRSLRISWPAASP